MKVSVIMPSFQVVHYIRECLESVVSQTLKEIEIICVDADSTDGTREIIKEYAKRDNRIILVNDDQKSCGYSYNKGIALARGEYVGFVETDDYVRKDMFETLYNLAKKNQLDYVKGNHIPFISVDNEYRYFEEERIFSAPELRGLYGRIFNPLEYPEILWPDHCMWNGIYDRTFLKKSKIKLNETKGASYQDHGFQWQTMCSARRAMYIDEGLYYYRRDNESASMKNPKGMIKDFAEFIFVKEYLKANSLIKKGHWWVYYQKMLGSIRSWSSNLLVNCDVLPEAIDEIFDRYLDEFREGEAQGYFDPIKIGFDRFDELQMLLKSKELYISYLRAMVQSRISYQNRKIEELSNKNQIVIAGAGNFGKKLFVLLKKNKVETVCAFCDNDKEKQQTKLFGKSVLDVQKCIEQYGDAHFVIANAVYYMDIMRQLLQYGVEEKQISYYRITDMEL